MRNRPDSDSKDIRAIMLLRSLERLSDRATNIAEWLIYAITGELADLNA